MAEEFRHLKNCRACGQPDLNAVITLGDQRVVDFVKSPGDTKKPVAPLTLVLCERCGLLQLQDSVNPAYLYEEFWYKSGINESMRKSLQDIVSQSIIRSNLTAGDAVLDIGANDGTMLGMYPEGVITCGVDPSQQIMSEEAMKRMTFGIRGYFNTQLALSMMRQADKKFKVITAIAMFYDLEDPAQFLQDVKNVLHDDGIFIIQMNYLVTMLNRNCVDNICHEHLTYYSFTSLEWLLSKIGFSVIDAEVNEVNGGSLRVYLKKAPVRRDEYIEGAWERIQNIIDAEEDMELKTMKPYEAFSRRVKKILDGLNVWFTQQVLKGKKCYAYGASTRGTVLLQACELPKLLSGVAERDPNKHGLFMVANWLKIYDEETIRKEADIMLVLPWHFKDAIVERERAWLNNGGTLVFPLPVPTIVTAMGERQLSPEEVFSSRGKQNYKVQTIGGDSSVTHSPST